MTTFEEDKLYVIEGRWLNSLYRLSTKFCDGHRMDDNERRDAGQWIQQGFCRNIVELDDDHQD